MGLSGQRPREIEKITSWKNWKLPDGETVSGHIAGDAIGVHVHSAKSPSKPCLKIYCGAAVECPGCAAGFRMDWLAYQPFYRDLDGKPSFVVMHLDQIDSMDSVQFHQHVRFQRSGDGSGIRMTPILKYVPFQSTLKVKLMPFDFRSHLPTLWRYKDRITPEQLRDPAALPKPAAVIPTVVVQPAIIETNDADYAPAELVNRIAKYKAEQARVIENAVDVVIEAATNGKSYITARPKNGKPK